MLSKRATLLFMMGLLVVAMMTPVGSHAHSQDESPPLKYGFWFWDQTPNGNIGVAVLDTNNEWSVAHLNASEGLVWSPDGQALYNIEHEVVPFEPPSDLMGGTDYGRIVAAYAYPDWHLVRKIEVLPDAILEDRTLAEVLRIQSVSPDGHYMWLVGTRLNNHGTLINLKTGAIVTQTACPGEVLGWVGSRAVVHSTFGLSATHPQECPPSLYTVDAATGGIATFAFETSTLGVDPRFYLTQMIYLPRWDAIIVASTPPPAIALLKLDGTDSFLVDFALQPTVSPDQQYLYYLADELTQRRLMRLDLATAVAEPLDVGNIGQFHWEGDTLVYTSYWRDSSLRWEIVEHRVYPGGHLSSLLIHYGSQTSQFSRDRVLGQIEIDYLQVIQVVQYGQVLWSSAGLFPHQSLATSPITVTTLGEQFVWLFASDYSYGPARTNYLLDLQRLEIVPVPEGWQVAGLAPDGAWLFCIPIEDSTSHQYGLMAYHRATGATVMLSETAHLHPSNVDAFPFQYFFHWSPPALPPK